MAHLPGSYPFLRCGFLSSIHTRRRGNPDARTLRMLRLNTSGIILMLIVFSRRPARRKENRARECASRRR
ncbi:hypothetical protein BC937DRAFT_86563 [Endogone sp. FLAS-F59071]|nr:hypothetical protein BC937DRAFT_86563 [Endogone sp. FLAS-F59071]|eukprot:RUS20015.1 hypothetical protein BC937DRAFT_86563 [Endogone sp. FLAS-F59071]